MTHSTLLKSSSIVSIKIFAAFFIALYITYPTVLWAEVGPSKISQESSDKKMAMSPLSHTYSPQGCETEVSFPQAPQIQRKCSTGAKVNDCTDVVTYRVQRNNTSPFTLKQEKNQHHDDLPASSLNIRVTCQIYAPERLNSFTDEVLKSALDQMLKEQNYETTRDIDIETVSDIRHASSISMGRQNGLDHIYTGQIWKGQKSLFTIEAQLVGPENEELIQRFFEILRSTHPKSHAASTAGKPTTAPITAKE